MDSQTQKKWKINKMKYFQHGPKKHKKINIKTKCSVKAAWFLLF